jgi:hypothetical protein
MQPAACRIPLPLHTHTLARTSPPWPLLNSHEHTPPAPSAGAGVIRVGANGASQATATSLPCTALPRDLRVPFNTTA